LFPPLKTYPFADPAIGPACQPIPAYYSGIEVEIQAQWRIVSSEELGRHPKKFDHGGPRNMGIESDNARLRLVCSNDIALCHFAGIISFG
jgi:hypothetical protein